MEKYDIDGDGVLSIQEIEKYKEENPSDPIGGHFTQETTSSGTIRVSGINDIAINSINGVNICLTRSSYTYQ